MDSVRGFEGSVIQVSLSNLAIGSLVLLGYLCGWVTCVVGLLGLLGDFGVGLLALSGYLGFGFSAILGVGLVFLG